MHLLLPAGILGGVPPGSDGSRAQYLSSLCAEKRNGDELSQGVRMREEVTSNGEWTDYELDQTMRILIQSWHEATLPATQREEADPATPVE